MLENLTHLMTNTNIPLTVQLTSFLIQPSIMVAQLVCATIILLSYAWDYRYLKIFIVGQLSFLILFNKYRLDLMTRIVNPLCQSLWHRNLNNYLDQINNYMLSNNTNWSIPIKPPYNPCLELEQYTQGFRNNVFEVLFYPDYQLFYAFTLLILNFGLITLFINSETDDDSRTKYQSLNEYSNI